MSVPDFHGNGIVGMPANDGTTATVYGGRDC